jgi:N-acetylglucosaminyldiphosphoundecaprenol N-acetyl-beta-D-mannosaminyltransferase
MTTPYHEVSRVDAKADQNSHFEEFDFFGLRLHNIGKASILSYISDTLDKKQFSVIFGFNLTVIPKLKQHPEILTLSNKFDALTADGKGLFLMANLFGANLQTHLSLPELVADVLPFANEKKYRILLWGATQEVNDAAFANIKTKYPNIDLHGMNGYFAEADEPRLFEMIKQLNPDIILIGMSSPKKEWLATKLKAVLSRGIIIPCGGVIDIYGGKTKREPHFIKIIGMTWLYRFVQEPVRLFRPMLVNGLYFMFILFPLLVWQSKIRKNKTFSFQKFYGIPRTSADKTA